MSNVCVACLPHSTSASVPESVIRQQWSEAASCMAPLRWCLKITFWLPCPGPWKATTLVFSPIRQQTVDLGGEWKKHLVGNPSMFHCQFLPIVWNAPLLRYQEAVAKWITNIGWHRGEPVAHPRLSCPQSKAAKTLTCCLLEIALCCRACNWDGNRRGRHFKLKFFNGIKIATPISRTTVARFLSVLYTLKILVRNAIIHTNGKCW